MTQPTTDRLAEVLDCEAVHQPGPWADVDALLDKIYAHHVIKYDPAAAKRVLVAALKTSFETGASVGAEFAHNDGERSWSAERDERFERHLKECTAPVAATQSLSTDLDKAQQRLAVGDGISAIWEQARCNHETYSATGSSEDDLRFLTLGLVGEVGELANFVKKRWRDGDPHLEASRKECADVLAYTMMVAQQLGMTPASLIEAVADKQAVFVGKMEARAALNPQPTGKESGERATGMQHVAYFDEGTFHWMSGIAPRDCEFYAKWIGKDTAHD